MSAKTTGEEGDDADADAYDVTEHHQLFPMSNEFVTQMNPYMNSPDLIPLTYTALISGKDGTMNVTFERTKLIPRAAVLRASNEKGNFDYNLAHAVALAYNDEILACNNFVCKECDEPAKYLMHTPTTQWEEDPPLILDFSVTPSCGKQECFHKSKSSTLNMFADLNKLMRRVKEKTGEEIPTRAPGEMSRSCLKCGKIANSNELRKCSRCKRVYYCDKECQRKSWKKHKKDCRPPEES